MGEADRALTHRLEIELLSEVVMLLDLALESLGNVDDDLLNARIVAAQEHAKARIATLRAEGI